MLRHKIAEFLHRLDPRLLNFLRWALKDSIGRITVLGLATLASSILQINYIEFDYGLQNIIHLLTIGGPFLIFVFCLTSREIGMTQTASESLTSGILIILQFGIILILLKFILIVIILPLMLLMVSSILTLIIWVIIDVRNNLFTRTGYILCNTFLSGSLVSLIMIAMTFGYFPATLINRTYKENQIVISVYEYDDVNIIATADTLNYPCRYQVEQRQFVPGILVKIRELDSQCRSREERYSSEFRSKP
jgi:hypothetical protein